MQETTPTTPSVLDWTPSRATALSMNVAGTLVAVAGLLGFGILAAARSGSASFVIGGRDALIGLTVMVGATLALLVLHEAVHGLAMLAFGARPRFGFGVAARVMPYFYTTTDALFRLGPYLVVALAPTLLINAMAVAWVALGPWSGWFAVAAAMHLGGCVGDWWLSAVALRQPRGSRFEDLQSGLRVHLPAG